MSKNRSESTSFNNSEAAFFLGISPSTLEKSRVSGQLLGVEAPPYRRAGKSIRYLRQTLDDWLHNLPEYRHTSEEAVSKKNVSQEDGPCRAGRTFKSLTL